MAKEQAETMKVDGHIVEVGDASRDAQVVKVGIVGIASNVVLAVVKAIIGLLSNSIAIVLDAVNNLSDAASSLITIVGTKLAGKRPDRKHPFGYGRIEYLTTIIISTIVMVAGITSLQESVGRIMNPEVASYDTITLVIVAIAVLGKIALGLYTKRNGEKLKSGSLVASGTEALMDSVISAATLMAALIFIFFGISLEAWLGAIISIVIIKAGIDMLREVLSKIIGERVDADVTVALKETVNAIDGVHGAYDLILEDYGPDKLWGSVHVEVDDNMTAQEIDKMTRAISAAAYEKHKVVLHTVGIYSQNTCGEAAKGMRRDVYDLAHVSSDILEVHGFYLDETTKTAFFDLVVSFDARDRQASVDKIRGIMEERYPGYQFAIALDSDIAD